MKRTLLWIPAATVAVLVAGYFALTAGTVFLLPDEIDKTADGMTRDEVKEVVLEAGWIDNIFAAQRSQITDSLIGGRVGLRRWWWHIQYEGGFVTQIERRHIDWHEEA